jgi:hypothetical protein
LVEKPFLGRKSNVRDLIVDQSSAFIFFFRHIFYLCTVIFFDSCHFCELDFFFFFFLNNQLTTIYCVCYMCAFLLYTLVLTIGNEVQNSNWLDGVLINIIYFLNIIIIIIEQWNWELYLDYNISNFNDLSWLREAGWLRVGLIQWDICKVM